MERSRPRVLERREVAGSHGDLRRLQRRTSLGRSDLRRLESIEVARASELATRRASSGRTEPVFQNHRRRESSAKSVQPDEGIAWPLEDRDHIWIDIEGLRKNFIGLGRVSFLFGNVEHCS